MEKHQVIIFDGACNHCNGAVNFIIKRDAQEVFKFSSMQSETAQQLMTKHGIQGLSEDSFILFKSGQCSARTNAALEITRHLGGLWFLLRVFKIVPSIIREYFYRLLARNR